MTARYDDNQENDGYNFNNEYITTNDVYFRSPASRERQYPINPGRWSEPPNFKGHRESRNFSYVKDHRGIVIPSVRRPHNLPPLPRGAYRVPPPEPQPLLERQEQWTPPAQRGYNTVPSGEYDEMNGYLTQRTQPTETPPPPMQREQPHAQHRMEHNPGQQKENRKVYRAYIAPPPPENFPAFRSKFPRKPEFPDWGRIPAAEMGSLMDSGDHPALSRSGRGGRRQPVAPITSEYQATIHKMGGSVITRHTNSFKSSKDLAEDMEVKKRERLQRLEDAAKARADKQLFKMSKFKNATPRINSYHSNASGNPIAERLA